MPRADLLHEEIGILREIVRANDGSNVAPGAFGRKVDQLISAFYDEVGELTTLPLADIIDLFLMKVLYVERRSRDAQALAYIGGMLERYLRVDPRQRAYTVYLSDLIAETSEPGRSESETFEAYRTWADNALFVSGLFPKSLGRRRAGGMLGGTSGVDRDWVMGMGRRYYEMAAGHEHAGRMALRQVLYRLASFFDVYADALTEMSDRYVLGIDASLLTDKMLDAFNRYRATDDPRHLADARTYAALLKLDGHQWPALSSSATYY
jgi:hypothetical protein